MTYDNIEPSAFKRGEWVGYCDGAWRIVKRGRGEYEATPPADSRFVSRIRGKTLREISEALHSMNSMAPQSNPLARVKVSSPSMATGKRPTTRLIKRREATNKAPRGYYANPAAYKIARAGRDNDPEVVSFRFRVQECKAFSEWVTVAGFDRKTDAHNWAKARHSITPNISIRVVE